MGGAIHGIAAFGSIELGAFQEGFFRLADIWQEIPMGLLYLKMALLVCQKTCKGGQFFEPQHQQKPSILWESSWIIYLAN